MTRTSTNFESYCNALVAELEQSLGDKQGLLFDLIRYQLGWADPQGTPLPRSQWQRPNLKSNLCLLACEILCGDYRPALPAAAGLEFIHTFTVVHNDVQDGRPQIEERPSIWWLWGPGQAINAGDGFYALGRAALLGLQDRGVPVSKVLEALCVLDKACITMCEGQYMDLAFQERIDLSLGDYIKMVEFKSGAIMSCAMEIGALLAVDDRRTIEAFRLCGRKLGILSEIQESILGLWGGVNAQPPSPEVFNKKKSFPIVQTLENGDLKTKRKLGAIYFKRVLEPKDVQEILDVLDMCDARNAAEAAADTYFHEAMSALDDLDLPSQGLRQIQEVGRGILRCQM